MERESTSVDLRPDIQAALAEYDVEKARKKFIGRRIAPIWESGVHSTDYPIFRRAAMKKRENTDRAPRGKYNRSEGQFGKGTFRCEEHGLEALIDDVTRRKYASMFDCEEQESLIKFQQILLDHECRVYQLMADTAFTNHNVTTAWSVTDTSVPIADLQAGIDAIGDAAGLLPEDISLVIPRADFREMLLTAQVIDKSKYTYPGLIPAELNAAQVAAMLGIKEVLVARSAYDSTEEGVAETNAQIWTAGKMWLAATCDENAPLKTPAVARTILWTEDSPVFPTVESYRDDEARADIVRVRCNTDEVLMGDEPDLFAYQVTNT